MKSFLAKIHPRRLIQLVILISFLVTFILTRVITHLQRAGILRDAGFLTLKGGELHVHHLVPGIFLLLLSGYLGLSFTSHFRLRVLLGILFGAGAALTLDEFALWLFLQDVYWKDQGEISIDIVIITLTILVIGYILAEAHDLFLKRKREGT